jgi:hypothetical protein
MSEPRYQLRYFFDSGSGVCLWSSNAAARERFGYAVEADQLGLSTKLCRQHAHMCAWFDTSVDWDDPAGPSPWTLEEAERFDDASTSMLRDLRQELGSEFAIADERRTADSDAAAWTAT